MRLTEYCAYVNGDTPEEFTHLTVTKQIKKDRRKLTKTRKRIKTMKLLKSRFVGNKSS